MSTRLLQSIFAAVAIVVALGPPSVSAQDNRQVVSFQPQDGRLAISIDGQPFATYVWGDSEILRPYFSTLHAPGGVQVTRNYPPIAGKDPTDHATMHPGLWLGFGDISGVDFWRNKGRVEHVEFVEKPTFEEGVGRFAVKNAYVSAGKTVCEEICRIEIRPSPDGWLLVWDSRFTGPDEFVFGDQEEMGLGMRMATPMAVKNGGRIINSDGLENEKQVWGKQAKWCDYSGTMDGRAVGILLMGDPANFRAPWFHARDYGLLVANPFGVNAFAKGPLSKVAVKSGVFRLRFGVLVHAGPIDLATAFEHCMSRFTLENP